MADRRRFSVEDVLKSKELRVEIITSG